MDFHYYHVKTKDGNGLILSPARSFEPISLRLSLIFMHGFCWKLKRISEQEYFNLSNVHIGLLNPKTNDFRRKKIEQLFCHLTEHPHASEHHIGENYIKYHFLIEGKECVISVPLVLSKPCTLFVYDEKGIYMDSSSDKKPKLITKLYEDVQLLYNEYLAEANKLRNEISLDKKE